MDIRNDGNIYTYMIFFFCGLSLDTSDWNIFRKKKKKKNVIKIFEVLFKNNNVIAFNTFVVFTT